MGFRKGAYAKVWEVNEGSNKYSTQVRLSVSRKKKDSEEYEQEFSGFCQFMFEAKAKAEKDGLKNGDRIRLGDTDVCTWYNKEKGKEYISYKVFSYETADEAANDSNSKKTKQSSDTGVTLAGSGLEEEETATGDPF